MVVRATWNFSRSSSARPREPYVVWIGAGAECGRRGARYASRLPHVVDASAAVRRAPKFPFATSVRMSFSSVRSETARWSRWFSVPSSLSRSS